MKVAALATRTAQAAAKSTTQAARYARRRKRFLAEIGSTLTGFIGLVEAMPYEKSMIALVAPEHQPVFSLACLATAALLRLAKASFAPDS